MITSLQLADIKKDYLFRTRPDLFPEGYLTFVETELWGRYYEQKQKRNR